MSDQVLVDALPYFDQGYDDPGVRETALAMVEEETRRYRPTKNYLEHLPTPNYHAFETEVMKAEYERLQSRLPVEGLSMKRYELPQPPPGKLTDVAAWQEAVDNSRAQLEHQALRILNLNVMADYGAELWKRHNQVLAEMVRGCERQLAAVRAQIQEINWSRKSEQLACGDRLQALEDSWVGYVSKNFEIERACVELEAELESLQAGKDSLQPER